MEFKYFVMGLVRNYVFMLFHDEGDIKLILLAMCGFLF
jgi:hypothetical protein